ncbi:MAG: hypothetical protein QOK06_2644, partial [Acidimicrobiaceae bacterium]
MEVRISQGFRPRIVTKPGADRGPKAGSPLGVVDATGSYI